MQQLVKMILPTIALCGMCMLTSACHPNTDTAHATQVDKKRTQEINYLTQQGVDVIDLGQTIRLTFPSNQFFQTTSTTLNPNQTATLENVASFTNSFPGATISIIGYSDNVLPNQEAKANSLAQAQAIAGFLWNDGLPSNRMKVEGKGYVAPLNDLGSPAAGAQNRRVEMLISLQN